MVSLIALAVEDKKIFKKFSEEAGIQIVELNPEIMESPDFLFELFDLIIWQPEFTKGAFPKKIYEYLKKNDRTGLVIYTPDHNSVNIPEDIPESLVYFIEPPIKRSNFISIIHRLTETVRQILKMSDDQGKNKNGSINKLTGEAAAIKQINEFVNFLAKTPNAICLLRYENGTEKDLIIKMIHHKGETVNGPLRIINCASYSEQELLKEIFGMEHNDENIIENKRGLLELADSGTLILENIEKISEEIQFRIHAYLETHTFRRIGACRELKANTRIVATTNYDLEKFVNFGSFSRELYFRFKAFEIIIPPLRKRKNDILHLSRYFIDYYNQKFEHNVIGLTPEAEQMFVNYTWPGNVEELKLILKRAVLLAKEGQISLSVLPIDMGQQKITDFESEFLGNCSLRDIERLHIERVLLRTKGNKSKAAELLNISRTTLREKMRLFNLPH